MSRKYDHSPVEHPTNRQLNANKEEWQNQLEKEWKREVRNLNRRIKDIKDLGADIVDVKLPKRITEKAVEKVKAMRREYLQKRARVVDKDTGEAKKWKAPERGKAKERREEVKEQRRQEREQQEAQQPVNIVDVELQNLRQFIETYANPFAKKSTLEAVKNELLSYVDYAIQLYGEKEVAMRAEDAANARGFAQQAMDESKQETQRTYINGFSNILFGRSFTLAELVALEAGRENLENFEA